MDRFDDDTLFAELRELRPTPRPEFTAGLDERAAAGFPRGADTTASVFAPIVDWWRGMKPTRRVMPVLGVALTVLVVATVAVGISQSGGGSSSSEVMTSAMSEEAAEPSASAGEAATAAPPRASSSAGGAGGTEESGSVEAESMLESAPPAVEAPSAKSAEGAGGRDVERSSYIVLGTKPGEVTAASAKIYDAVHAAGGYVLRSSVQSGTTGATGAEFELRIPSAKLDDTLAAISAIAEVRERHDATNDITAPTVSVAEELADSNAAITGLLKQLGEVETEAEQESVEARLREERRHHAAIRASLDHLHTRATMSDVTVHIVTNYGAGATPPSKGGGDWGVGDALHDAGHYLTIAAGVAVIGLAILAPFALIALIFWAGNRFRLRRLRERTLG
ncbi:MAG: hypothetical protein BGO11_22100 [Solirubrobacterales bacterium 70-9]|nr:MAG: hypothetical protein BGO11_22100 [Solirubrobacterales bacterium 70-9]